MNRCSSCEFYNDCEFADNYNFCDDCEICPAKEYCDKYSDYVEKWSDTE